MPGGGPLEATPLVVDGVMYTTGVLGRVFAPDARTGRTIWQYQRRRKLINPYDSTKVNRGVAMLGGRIFFTTSDAYLVALDAKSGLPLWETQMADHLQGLSGTMAPLALKDKIVAGISGAEFGVRALLTPTTRPPASACGASTRFPAQASSATIPGKAIAGAVAAPL